MATVFRFSLVIILLLQTFISVAKKDLVEAAKERLNHFIIYDGKYQQIAYPNGDVDKNKGVCTDLVIRSYRTLGIDLQQLVHEDMLSNFDKYSNYWGLKKPDSNIDHRRVPNLETFFIRHAQILPITKNPQDYAPGDIVTWRIKKNYPHIGIVSDEPAKTNNNRMQIIHNIGLGPQMEDMLFDYEIVGHFRYQPNHARKTTAITKSITHD